MVRSLFISFGTYIVFTFILPLPFGNDSTTVLGQVPISVIIAISIGLIEYLYRSYIPSEDWEPWDVLAIVIVSLTLIYGYIMLHAQFLLAVAFCILSILSYVFVKVGYYFLSQDTWDENINMIRAYRNHFAVPIIVAFMFIPVSISLTLLDGNVVSQFNKTTFPFNTSLSRETLIIEYLLVKYPDISSFDDWSESRIVEFLQDIEFIEANESSRKPVEIQFDELSDNTYGYYSLKNNHIRINSKYLRKRTPFEWIDSILHEGRHAYQFQLISQVNWNDPIVKNSPQFSELNRIFQGFTNYNVSNNEFEEYYNQFIEVDARQFSSEILPIYVLKLLTP
jgi:hypothetical protein